MADDEAKQSETSETRTATTIDRFVCPHPGCGGTVTIARVAATTAEASQDMLLHALPVCSLYLETEADDYGRMLLRSRS